jgi:hypothetical protein
MRLHVRKCTSRASTASNALNSGCSDMNDRSNPATVLVSFATICREAAERHGDDWPAVERHIKKRFDALPTDQRERLKSEIDRVLRYRAPQRTDRGDNPLH